VINAGLLPDMPLHGNCAHCWSPCKWDRETHELIEGPEKCSGVLNVHPSGRCRPRTDPVQSPTLGRVKISRRFRGRK